MPSRVNRRDFLKGSAAGASAVAAGFGASPGAAADPQQAEGSTRRLPANSKGRPVEVVSIGFYAGHLPLERIAELVDREGAKGADVIALPETCRGQNQTSHESLDGPMISVMKRLARLHRTYIVCPIDRKDGARRYNSAVILDRSGNVACIYNKMYPVWRERASLGA